MNISVVIPANGPWAFKVMILEQKMTHYQRSFLMNTIINNFYKNLKMFNS